MSLILSLILITTGCRTTKVEREIVLPPKPQRQELKAPKDLKDLADLLNYYEHLVEDWENWGNTVSKLIETEK